MTAPQQDPQSRLASVAVQAAALYAAVKVGQDVTAVVGQAVTVAAQTAQNGADIATRMIVSLWRTTNPYDQRSVDRFLAQSGRVIVATQRAVASTAVASQLTQLRAVGINTKVAVTIPDTVRGSQVQLGPKKAVVQTKPKTTVEYQPEPAKPPRVVPSEPAKPPRVEVRTAPSVAGPAKSPRVEVRVAPSTTSTEPRPAVQVVVRGGDAAPQRVFNRVVVTYRYQRAEGDDHATASSAAEERIASIVDGNVTLAQRLGEQQTLAQVHAIDERVIGWRRVIHPELSKGGVCGLCVAASDRVYSMKTLKPIHARCKCSISPVTKSNDPGVRLNREDLDRLYDDAGDSTYGRQLKRTRYVIEHHHELGPVLVRVKGEKVPFYSVLNPASTDGAGKSRKPSPQAKETPRDVAERHLPALRASLQRLRERGLAEDSAPVRYHLAQIAKFESLLAKAA